MNAKVFEEWKGKSLDDILHICKDLVERCQGRITARNSPSGGSIFTVHLPAASPHN